LIWIETTKVPVPVIGQFLRDRILIERRREALTTKRDANGALRGDPAR
jgi:hypothetical protein